MITSTPTIYHAPPTLDPNSTPTTNEPPDTSAVSRTKRGVADKRYLWPQNHTITISFLDTPQATKRLVQKSIGVFAGLINLKFKFVEGNEGDIRISAHRDIQGTWSKLGTTALSTPKDQPTMHVDLNTAPADLRHYILHEFGHALGVEHEHHHPDRTVQYDEAKTYQVYNEQLGWGKGMTDHQVLRKVDPANAITTPYDRKSIMHYNVPPEMTSNNEGVAPNKTLSDADKEFLKSLYPLPRPTASEIQARRFFRKGLI
ncbi:hypothetical protein BFW87_27080 [Pseudomonas fluorescens]|uniref:Peptidase metallopeptidase domain-containing protein n=1 Tax=Pseudomonas fluorescens TaxID=294 RepID=A0A1T2Y0X4_PSEFL|nr:M12 family metallopeptidase [Pseudomonas fluorescens]OPA85705.1 hypothetical protein BFW87_27080 [Pseudomonas fluorescens]